jgi:hypothetical protein
MKSFLEGRPSVDRKTAPPVVSAARTNQFPDLQRPPMEATSRMLVPSEVEPEVESEPEPVAGAHRDKKIETVEADGVIQKIVITCGCGEVIEVHCGY